MGGKREYDWIDDPFDEKKAAEEQEQLRMSGCSKVGIIAALAAVVLIAAFVAFTVWAVVSLGGPA